MANQEITPANLKQSFPNQFSFNDKCAGASNGEEMNAKQTEFIPKCAGSEECGQRTMGKETL